MLFLWFDEALNIIHLQHDSEGDVKINSPEENHIPWLQCARGI